MKILAETKLKIGSQKSEDTKIQFFKMAQLINETVLCQQERTQIKKYN